MIGSRKIIIPEDATLKEVIELLNQIEFHADMDTLDGKFAMKYKDWIQDKDA